MLAAFCRGRANSRWLASVLLIAFGAEAWSAEPVVPGTGRKVAEVGDDFEDESWEYIAKDPKSSQEQDGAERYPAGESRNGRWYEGVKRGHPDVVKRVETPSRGLPGSQGSLLLQSLQTGVPGAPRFRLGQDDFIADVQYRLGTTVQVSREPNAVVRVFLPPVDQWEDRTGPHFGFRLALETSVSKPSRGLLFSAKRSETETYWPGMFIEFESQTDGREHDFAYLRLRGDATGGDFRSKQITTTGWWTLGMSVTADGMVHYYARPGVEDLTADDRLGSEYPYGFHAETFRTMFFNVCNGDDGKTWSTPWIIDDPTLYLAR